MMVTRFGMSPELGNVDLASNHDTLSTTTKQKIESEVRRIVEDGRSRAKAILEAKRKELEYLAKALIDYETLDKDEAWKVVKGEKLVGKLVMPSGSIKVPEMGQHAVGGVGALPDLPKIPGSAQPEGNGGKGPPEGGVVA